LNASFRPEDIICRLRSLHRHRDNLVSSSASEIQHMQKALQEMNLHLHHAVSDITGLSGLRIIDAILGGERDPEKLVKLRDRSFEICGDVGVCVMGGALCNYPLKKHSRKSQKRARQAN